MFKIQDKVCFQHGSPPQDQTDVDVDKKKRTNHTALERQRRFAQRGLFNKLQNVLKSQPGASRHHLLTMVSPTQGSKHFPS